MSNPTAETMTTSELLDLIGGHVEIGPTVTKPLPPGHGKGWLMGNRIREYDRYGSLVSDETVYNVRVFW